MREQSVSCVVLRTFTTQARKPKLTARTQAKNAGHSPKGSKLACASVAPMSRWCSLSVLLKTARTSWPTKACCRRRSTTTRQTPSATSTTSQRSPRSHHPGRRFQLIRLRRTQRLPRTTPPRPIRRSRTLMSRMSRTATPGQRRSEPRRISQAIRQRPIIA